MQIGPGIRENGLEAIGRSRAWLEVELKSRAIELHPESGLQQSLNALRALEEKARQGTRERLAAVEVQRRFLNATGADFLSKALHWGDVSGLDSFDGHWKYLKSSNPIVTGPAVNGNVAQERAFAWELALASVAATFCNHVHNAEPDLICEWEGKRIAIAAKFLFEDSRRAFVRHVEKGIAQIEMADVAGGCVVINLVDLFPHATKFDWLHRIRAKYLSTLTFAAVDWVDDFLEGHHPDWRRLFKGKSKLMTIAMFVPTVLPIWRRQSMLLPVYRLHLFSATEREDEAFRFTSGLQRAFDTVLGFDSRDPAYLRGTSP